MTGPNMITILIKTTLDTFSRIIIISMFIHLYHDGNFNTLVATSIYYGHVVIMLIYNVVFNTAKPSFNKTYLIGLLLNSLSSFFNLNLYNYNDMLHYESNIHSKKETQFHQPTFLRQAAYYTIFLGENMLLTALSLTTDESEWKLKDGYGTPTELTSGNVLAIFGFAWLLQLVSFVFQTGYYGSHPSSVSLTEMRDKMKVHLFGTPLICETGCSFVKGDLFLSHLFLQKN